jgi:Tfp pilus assembly protein PilO
MTRFILPIILIGIAIAGFFMFTRPFYENISALRLEAASYNEALANSKALENERDKLTAKYNSISAENLMKVQKLLPDNIDNIRLILEIEKIASPYGMVLKDVRYDTNEPAKSAASTAGGVQGGGLPAGPQKDYGVWNLAFSTSGTYSNFLNFSRDLESNLRIVDIASVSFSSADTDLKTNPTGVYKYDFKIKTYWLKN